jgi:RNA polymerase sigma-70 factor (ECF subfamily)
LRVVEDRESPPAAEPDDAELIGRVRRGDPSGAEGLFTRYSGPLLGFTDRMLGSRSEAEEITQDVFLKVISRAGQFDGRASVSTWIFAIAANACRDRMRRSKTAGAVPLESVPEPHGSERSQETRLLERERRQIVRDALARLTREQREALLLARYRGMPYADVARTLGISEGAVKTRVFRAVETLKQLFSEGGPSWSAVKP